MNSTIQAETEAPRFCGVVQRAGAAAGYWAIDTLSWAVMDELPGIPTTKIVQAIFAATSAVCGLQFRQADVNDRPNLVYSVGRGGRANFDGRGGTLAWAQLPAPRMTSGTLLCRADLDERWLTTQPQTIAEGIEALPVYQHETGHLLGLEHATKGLMRPTYDPRVRSWQPPDIITLQAMHGPGTGQRPLDPVKPDASQLRDLIDAAEDALEAVISDLVKAQAHARHGMESLLQARLGIK